jgi:hypothetical protein
MALKYKNQLRIYLERVVNSAGLWAYIDRQLYISRRSMDAFPGVCIV